MEINRNELWTGWMTWEQIEPFKEQIIDMELDSMITWHYPDWDIPRSYPEQKVAELKQHLANGNTWFWGALYHGKLLAYRWAYTMQFINRYRWVGKSMEVVPEARGLGLYRMALEAEDEKVQELGCDDMETLYAPFNKAVESNLARRGWKVTRIEVVKELKDPEKKDE